MRGKKSGIHAARKKRKTNFDSGKLDVIQTHLENLGYNVLREITKRNGNYSTPNNVRVPDFKVSFGKKFEVLIELDGESAHGTLEQPKEKTIRRNGDYEVTHENYIILSEPDAKFFNLDIADLAGYRINEEYSKHLAKVDRGMMYI